MGTVIVHESHGRRPVFYHVFAERFARQTIGAAKTVNRLFFVADDKEGTLAFQRFQQANLQRVRILKFIYEQMIVSRRSHPEFQESRGFFQKILKIHCAFFPLRLAVRCV